MDSLRFQASNGRNWMSRIVRKGDRYGLDNCLVHGENDPMVEFWDLNHTDKFGPDGQFVSRYYVATLLTHELGIGLDLQGDIPEWKIDGHVMIGVLEWLRNV